MRELAVEVDAVSRVFGRGRREVVALRDVSFQVQEGQVLGVLGSNGAGKTTLTKILATLLEPTTGTARIFGYDVAKDLREVRRLIGVVFGGDRGFYGALSGRENLRYFAVLAGVRAGLVRARVDSALAEVGLTEAASRPVETYSKGMRQRLHIALGLIAEPRVLLLDEPTVGLDPVEAERLRGAIAQMSRSGVSVILTSHYLLDIERLADRVLVIERGEVKADTTAADFLRLAGFAATVTVRGTGPIPASLESYGAGLESIEVHDAAWTVQLRIPDWGGDVLSNLGAMLAGTEIVDVSVAPVRLEDVYKLLLERLAGDAPATPQREGQ